MSAEQHSPASTRRLAVGGLLAGAAAAATEVSVPTVAQAATGGSAPLVPPPFPNLQKKTTPQWHPARRAWIAPTASIAAEIQRRTPAGWVAW